MVEDGAANSGGVELSHPKNETAKDVNQAKWGLSGFLCVRHNQKGRVSYVRHETS